MDGQRFASLNWIFFKGFKGQVLWWRSQLSLAYGWLWVQIRLVLIFICYFIPYN